ncbi:MAG: undecaprenyldiphospho-muramoylpentapeptide beta-N-acetylglucosaminyltransferase [Acidobacteriota bacterium]
MTGGSSQLLMIAGGGTGGHIYPAIAVAQEYLRGGSGRSVVFVGTEYGLEKSIVPRAGFPLEFISVRGLKGKSLAQTLRNLFRLPLGLLQSWQLTGRHHPSAILGVGGYSSGPVVVAGWMRRIPALIHEANAFPGLTNRILSHFVKSVAVAFPEALERLGGKGEVTGNPIREEFFQAARRPSTGSGLRILVFGGSQGSKIINENFVKALSLLEQPAGSLHIVHQTGPSQLASVEEAYRQSSFHDARVVPYLDRMWEEIADADLIICRAGAMTIGELCAAGRASILIPFAAATNNHQEVNARVVEKAGGAVVITEKELTAERLASAIKKVVTDPGRAAQMGLAAATLAMPNASIKIVEIIERIQKN